MLFPEAVLFLVVWGAIMFSVAAGLDGYLADRRNERRVHDALLEAPAKQ